MDPGKSNLGKKVGDMSTKIEEQFTWPQAFASAFAIIAILASSILMAEEATSAEEQRTTVSAFYAQGGRDQATPDKVSKDELAPFSAKSTRDRTALRSSKLAGSINQTHTVNTDFWFYLADVVLFADQDNDGYFAGIDLLFDADTYYSRAEVYAVAYLSWEGGPWEEYAVTEVFVINDTSADDEYVVVTDLVSGYPTGSYDILIELFDAYDDAFVADIGPENTSELAFLPLEDAGRDAFSPGPTPGPVVINHGSGGGSMNLLTLAVLLGVAAIPALRRRRLLDSLRQARSHARSA
jgi:hypothetical protein